MKFKYLVTIVLCSIFLGGCQPMDPKVETIGNAAIADAAGAMEGAAAIMGSCPLCTGSPTGIGAVAVVSVIYAIAASEPMAQLYKGSIDKSNKVDLDSNLISPLNPYEIIGRNHNYGLKYVDNNSNPNRLVTGIESYDYSIWKEVAYNFESNNNYIDSGYIAAKSLDVSNILSTKFSFFLNDSIMSFEKYLGTSSFDQMNRDKVLEVVKKYRDYLLKSSSQSAISYLQDELNKILRPELGYSEQEILFIIFLTTLKWSTLFWYK